MFIQFSHVLRSETCSNYLYNNNWDIYYHYMHFREASEQHTVKFNNVRERFIWRCSWSCTFKLQNVNTHNIIHVTRLLTKPELTSYINPRKRGFVSKTQTLIPRTLMNLQYMYFMIKAYLITITSREITPTSWALVH